MGTDKASLVIAGEPLAVRTARVLSEVAAPCLEVGPGRSPLPVVADDVPQSGPLAALAAGAAALQALGHPGPALVVATDLPFLGGGLLRYLAGHPSRATVVPMHAGHRQPLVARYAPAALIAAPPLVAAGERALHALLAAVAIEEVPEDEWARHADGRELEDVDTPADLARLGLANPRRAFRS